MPHGVTDATNLIWSEGQSIILDFERTSPTTAKLSWNIPKNSKTYNGVLILASVQELNASNLPTDSVKYHPSTNYQTPVDRIGNAHVVGAFYNDKITTILEITNLNPDDVYYCSAHLITNVNQYYTTGTKSYPTQLQTEAYASDIQRSFGPPTNPYLGQPYFDENQKLIFFWDGTMWIQKNTGTTRVLATDPLPNTGQSLGDFYYNSITKSLKIWTGINGWIDAETSKNGTPIYNKQDVGTDLTYDERANLIDILKKQLGHPVVCVELTEDHFNIAIDNALLELRRRSDSAYNQQFFFMTIQPDQQTYYLNDLQLGTAKIADVLKIYRVNYSGMFPSTGTDSVYMQSFMNQFRTPNTGFDLVSMYLMNSLGHLQSLLFASDIPFNWRESPRELTIYRKINRVEKVLVECSIEKTEQELLLDRWTQNWIQNWAESECMYTLGLIRSKFGSVPGPGGGITLNGSELISLAKDLQADCLRQISDFEVGQNGPGGFQNSSFIIG